MKERPIINEEWEAINLRPIDRPFSEKTEEERQLEYFHKGEAVDFDYMLGLNPNMREYFGTLIDAGAASMVEVDIDEEIHNLVQLNQDPDEGEPRFDPNDKREWTEQI